MINARQENKIRVAVERIREAEAALKGALDEAIVLGLEIEIELTNGASETEIAMPFLDAESFDLKITRTYR